MMSDPPKLVTARQTLYLGQVERSRVGGRIRLLAARSINSYWIPLPTGEFIKLPSEPHDLHHKMLVLLELNSSLAITQLLTADTEIIAFLNYLASSVERIVQKEDDIRLWRESLQFQSEEFMRRTEALELREAEIEARLKS